MNTDIGCPTVLSRTGIANVKSGEGLGREIASRGNEAKAPLVVFLVAYGVGLHSSKLAALAKASPALAAFSILLFTDLIENGTVEFITPGDIVRPLTSFLALIFLMGLLRAAFPTKQRLAVYVRCSTHCGRSVKDIN